MHPEILRQMIEQHSRETQARAKEERLARTITHTLRLRRRNGYVASSDAYAIPTIPDYVDGSFIMTTPGQAGSAAGRVPAARDAA
jgi:hypothetical protein